VRVELEVPKERNVPGGWEDCSGLGEKPLATLVGEAGDAVQIETAADPDAKSGLPFPEPLRADRSTMVLSPVAWARATRLPRAGHNNQGTELKVIVRPSNVGRTSHGDAAEDAQVTWGRSRKMQEFRGDSIQKFRRLYGRDILEGPGFYYGTIEVQFQVQGTAGPTRNPGQAVAAVSVVNQASPVIDTAFTLGIGDVSTTWFGGPHVMNSADTNLQNPNQVVYANEVFIVEAISARMRAARVRYSLSDIGRMLPHPTGPAAGSPAFQLLTGQQVVTDLEGEVIPREMWNQFSDDFRLAKVLASCSSLHFSWREPTIGGGGRVNDVQIAPFLAVPGTTSALSLGGGERGLRRTSGGAQSLDLPSGYLWCLDKNFQYSHESGGNGLFDAELHLDESASMTFIPIRVFGSLSPVGTPTTVLPTGFALYWEITLSGTSLLPSKQRRMLSREARRRY
jgi:hypothetical protein